MGASPTVECSFWSSNVSALESRCPSLEAGYIPFVYIYSRLTHGIVKVKIDPRMSREPNKATRLNSEFVSQFSLYVSSSATKRALLSFQLYSTSAVSFLGRSASLFLVASSAMATVTELCPVYAPFFGALVSTRLFWNTSANINEHCGY